MYPFKSLSLLLAICAIWIAAGCKSDTATPTGVLAHVPGTASGVATLNIKRWMEKADFEAVKKMPFYQEMLDGPGSKRPELRRIMLDPASSGIDLEQNAYMALEVNKDDPEERTMYVLFSLKNAEDFAALFKDGKSGISEKNGVKTLGDPSRELVGWNKGLAVFIFSDFSETPLQEKLLRVFDAKTVKAPANPDMLKALDGDHDIMAWMTTDLLADNREAGAALQLIDLDPDALKNNTVHAYADFEKGRFVGHADFHLNKTFGRDFIGRFFKKEVKTDFTNMLPGEGLAFVATMATDLRGMDQFLSERPQNRDFADYLLSEIGMNRKEMLEILNGDMLVSAYQGGNLLGDPKLMVAAGLKSKPKAQSLLDQMEKKGKLKKVSAGHYKVVSVGNEDFSITKSKGMGHVLLGSDQIVFSVSNELAALIQSGKFKKADKKILQNADNQTFSMWMDFGTDSNLLGTFQNDFLNDMQLRINGSGADFILHTKDPDHNSLHSLFRLMDEANRQRKEVGL